MARPRRSSVLDSLAPLGAALTADLDQTKFGFIHPKVIPFIQNPLEDPAQPQEDKQAPDELSPKVTQATVQSMDGGHGHPHHHHRSPFEYDPEQPRLRYETESSSIQLFYDLFFVANLTTFTGKHEINSGSGKFLPIR